MRIQIQNRPDNEPPPDPGGPTTLAATRHRRRCGDDYAMTAVIVRPGHLS